MDEDHLNKLKVAINDIKDTVEAKTYGVDPSVPLITPTFVPPIKVLIQKQALGANEEKSIGPCDNSTEIDFSELLLEKFYSIHQAATTELCLRKNVISYQEAKQQRKDKLRKALL